MEKLKTLLLGTLLSISLSECQSQKSFSYPDYYIDKIELMPDLFMIDKNLKLPDGGGYFCGPVSVANSLIYLHKHGYDKLMPSFYYDSIGVCSDLIRQLGGDDYMKTVANKMTPQTFMKRGLKRYVKESGYELGKIKYRAFGKRPNFDIDWLKASISNGYEIMVFLWIIKEVEPKVKKIVAGHWVSLAGYGKDETGNLNSDYLIIHDPGSGFDYNKNDFVELKLYETDFKADKKNFKNNYELMDFDCTNGADNIFIAAALSFKLQEPSK